VLKEGGLMTKNPVNEEQENLASKVRDILMTSGNCAQTSFVILQDEFDLEGDQVLRALTPFPGIALRGETCGAVIGCLMSLGLEFGRDDLSDWQGYIGSLPSVRRFCMRFEEQHDSTNCAGVLESKLGRNYDLADKVEALEYASSGGPEACSQVVASAIQIASEIIRKKG
jgi:C_GCAxxG_C_C family probable redox protein